MCKVDLNHIKLIKYNFSFKTADQLLSPWLQAYPHNKPESLQGRVKVMDMIIPPAAEPLLTPHSAH